MRFPVRLVESFEDSQLNYEFLESSQIYWGNGAPAFTPENNQVSYYFREDTPTVANQRIYVYTGSAWSGIL